jgi:precorrin-6B methylase 2
MSEKALDPQRIFEVAMGFWAAKTVLSAVELGVFSELAKGPLSAEALREKLALNPRGARDFFDALVALGFLERSNGLYANTPETDFFLDRAKPSYIGGMLEMANRRLYGIWGRLTEGLKTGLPQNEAREGGAGVFEAIYADPERLKLFLGAMTGVSRGANRAIAERLPWRNYQSFVDVGTAQGDLAVQVALAHPHLRGIGFDLPLVAPVFEAYVARAGVADRVSFRAGNFFTDPLPKADAVLMGHILHDWDLPTKKMLIAKAYEALPPGGAFVVYEALIDDARAKNVLGLLMSLNMLLETEGGFDFTGADCQGWMREAGFSATRVEPLTATESMVVAIK